MADFYIKIEDNVVVQKQRSPDEENGFVKVHPSIVCGMIHDGSDSYAIKAFKNPESDPASWDDVRKLQRKMIVVYGDMMEIHERETRHIDTAPEDYTITEANYQEMLTYFQTVRVNDEATHATPQEAVEALTALPLPDFLAG